MFFYKLILKIYVVAKRLVEYCNQKLMCKQLGKSGANPSILFPVECLGLKYISIGDNFQSGARLKLRAFDSWKGERFSPKIKIGNNVCIQTDCHISSINEVTIGDNVLIASFVYISDHMHGLSDYADIEHPPLQRNLSSRGGVTIGSNVWIGERATILPGVTIGEYAIIGAGSVVTTDIQAYSVACGSPARVIKTISK